MKAIETNLIWTQHDSCENKKQFDMIHTHASCTNPFKKMGYTKTIQERAHGQIIFLKVHYITLGTLMIHQENKLGKVNIFSVLNKMEILN